MWPVGHSAGRTCLPSLVRNWLWCWTGLCSPGEPVWRIIVTGKTGWGGHGFQKDKLQKALEYILSLSGDEHGIGFMDVCVGASESENIWMCPSTATSGRSYLLYGTNKMAPGQRLSEYFRGCEHAKPRWFWEGETVSRVTRQQKVFKGAP